MPEKCPRLLSVEGFISVSHCSIPCAESWLVISGRGPCGRLQCQAHFLYLQGEASVLTEISLGGPNDSLQPHADFLPENEDAFNIGIKGFTNFNNIFYF